MKQRELRGVAYNGSDGCRVWAYYETVYMAREDRCACRFVRSAGLGCKLRAQGANYSWSVGSGLGTRRSEAVSRGERARRSATGLRIAGKRGRDPAGGLELCAMFWHSTTVASPRPHRTFTATGMCPDGGLRGTGRDPGGLRQNPAPACPEARTPAPPRHHPGPAPSTVGQNNPVATKNHGGLDGKARHPPVVRQTSPAPRRHHAEHPPSAVSLAGIPAGRTMVLGALAPTAWRPPTDNTDTGPGPRRRRQLEAQQDAVPVGPPVTRRPLEGAEQYSDTGPHRQDWTGGVPLQATGTWLPHTGVQLWSAVGDSQTRGSRLPTPSPSAAKPVSSGRDH